MPSVNEVGIRVDNRFTLYDRGDNYLDAHRLLGKIKASLDEHLETTLPGDELGQALGYLGNQWPKLSRHIVANMQQRL